MAQATIATRAPVTVTAVDTAIDTASGVSWAAVIAGAFVAAAFSLALVALGAGIGLVSVSPWSGNNPSVTTFTVLAAAWFIAVQLFASGVGGYIAGRLRTRWARVHTDEVFFRDTAHGLLVWAVGAVIAARCSSAASSAVSGAAQLAGAATEAVGRPPGKPRPSGFNNGRSDGLFLRYASAHRSPGSRRSGRGTGGRRPDFDARSLQRRSSRCGQNLSGSARGEPDGKERAGRREAVADVFDQAKKAKEQAAQKAKQAAEAARKTGVGVALWAFISLLVGAFSASYMATVGGQQRDKSPLFD